jgi:hypothetical protein
MEPRGIDKGYIGARLAGSVPATHTEAQAGTSGPESEGRTQPSEARRGEATRKRRAIRRPAMLRNQKLLGCGVTSRNKTRTALEIPGLMPASYGWNFHGESSVACLFISFFL